MKALAILALSSVLQMTAQAEDCRSAPFPLTPTKWAESAFNRIFVYRADPCIKMTFRRVRWEKDQSVLNLEDRSELPVPYTRVLTVGVAYPDKVSAVAMLGVGGGSTINYLSEYLGTAAIVGVELDPTVLKLAKEDFRLGDNPALQLVESDGRVFLMRRNRMFDLMILDAYRDGHVPSHMLTRQFYELLSRRLSDSGVAAINLHYGTALFDSSVRTIQSVFADVDLYPAGGNVVVVASKRPIDHNEVRARAVALQADKGFRYSLPDIVQTRRQYQIPPTAKLLTDDFSPASQLEQIRSINAARRW